MAMAKYQHAVFSKKLLKSLSVSVHLSLCIELKYVQFASMEVLSAYSLLWFVKV